MATILSEIRVYPIKSCAGDSVESAVVSDTGLEGDRQWQVVDIDGGPITQRQHRVLATVRPKPTAHGGLQIGAPDSPPIEIGAPGEADTTVRSLFDARVPAWDAGDEAAQWFTRMLGEPRRLVAMTDPAGWRLRGDLDVFGQGAAFSDAAPILVATHASLAWLQQRASEHFGMDRFRPNLVVAGTEPWEEDSWSTFQVGGAELTAVLPWPRCSIPQIDQSTGHRHKEPARVLRAHRWCTEAPTMNPAIRGLLEGNGLFGIGCSIGPPGTRIAVGDSVSVSTTKAPILEMR
jgi:uncharacterized protein YcbX